MTCKTSAADFISALHVLTVAVFVCVLLGCSERKPAGPPESSDAAAPVSDSSSLDGSQTAKDSNPAQDGDPKTK